MLCFRAAWHVKRLSDGKFGYVLILHSTRHRQLWRYPKYARCEMFGEAKEKRFTRFKVMPHPCALRCRFDTLFRNIFIEWNVLLASLWCLFGMSYHVTLKIDRSIGTCRVTFSWLYLSDALLDLCNRQPKSAVILFSKKYPWFRHSLWGRFINLRRKYMERCALMKSVVLFKPLATFPHNRSDVLPRKRHGYFITTNERRMLTLVGKPRPASLLWVKRSNLSACPAELGQILFLPTGHEDEHPKWLGYVGKIDLIFVIFCRSVFRWHCERVAYKGGSIIDIEIELKFSVIITIRGFWIKELRGD